MNADFPMVDILLRGQLLQNHFILNFNDDEKQEVLKLRNTLLKQFKNYFDKNLNPAKGNVLDLTKYNFTQPLIVQ